MTVDQTRTASISELLAWLTEAGYQRTEQPAILTLGGQNISVYDALHLETANCTAPPTYHMVTNNEKFNRTAFRLPILR